MAPGSRQIGPPASICCTAFVEGCTGFHLDHFTWGGFEAFNTPPAQRELYASLSVRCTKSYLSDRAINPTRADFERSSATIVADAMSQTMFAKRAGPLYVRASREMRRP